MSNKYNEIYNEAVEDLLVEIHAKQYNGLDDDMTDDYEDWRSRLEDDDIEELLKQNNGKTN